MMSEHKARRRCYSREEGAPSPAQMKLAEAQAALELKKV